MSKPLSISIETVTARTHCNIYTCAKCQCCLYFQLSYTDEGLGVTLRRDVTKSQMLSGAIQTDADVNRGATYSVGFYLGVSTDIIAHLYLKCVSKLTICSSSYVHIIKLLTLFRYHQVWLPNVVMSITICFVRGIPCFWIIRQKNNHKISCHPVFKY